MEPMLMTLPPSGPKCLTASWVVRSRPRTLRLNCLWKCSSVTASSGRELIDAGVVDEDVEPAEGLFGFGEETVDVGLFGDVALDGDGFAALGGDFGDDFVRAGLAGGVIDDDGGAFGARCFGDGSADAFGGAGDDCDLII